MTNNELKLVMKRVGVSTLKCLGWMTLIAGVIVMAIMREEYRRDCGYYYRRWY